MQNYIINYVPILTTQLEVSQVNRKEKEGPFTLEASHASTFAAAAATTSSTTVHRPNKLVRVAITQLDAPPIWK